MKIKWLFLIASSVLIASIAIPLSVFLYKTQENALLEGIDNKLLTAAYCIEDILPEDYHNKIVGKASVPLNEYLGIVDTYNKLCVKLGLQYVWSLMMVDGQLVFTSGTSTDKDVKKGDHALFFDIHTNPDAYKEAFNTMKIQHTTFHDQWGDGRMVVIPKYDSKGRRYLLAASMSINDVNAMLSKTIANFLMIIAAVLFLGFILSVFLSTLLSKPIVHLTEIAKDIAGGNLKQKIEMRGPFELRKLSKSIEAMSDSIHDTLKEIETKNNELKVEIDGRKKIETALLESEALLKRSQAMAHVGTWRLDLKTNDLYWSDEVYKIFGVSPKEFDPTYEAFLKFVHPDDKAMVHQAFADAAKEQHPYDIVHRVIRPDKTVRFVHEKSEDVHNESGEIVMSVGMVHDITETKEVENVLRQKEATLNSIFRAAPTGIGMVVDRVLTWVNDRFCEMLAYPREELIHINSQKLYPSEEEFLRVGKEKYKQISKKGTGTVETKLVTKNGATIDVLLSSTPLDPSDLSQGVTFTALDITERKKAERRLRDSERTYREIFNASHDVIFIHDMESGAIVDVNVQATELYGYETDEILNMAVGKLSAGMPPYSETEALYWIQKTVEEGPQVFEWMARGKGGRDFWVEVSLKKASISGTDRLLAVVRNIQERKAAEKKLSEYRTHLESMVEQRTAEIQAKNKELETFTYSVSHDLKAPLRGIDGYSRLLSEDYADKLDEEGLEFLKNIRHSTEQMTQLIEDLLTYSRLERRDLRSTKINIRGLIDELVLEREHEISSRSVQVDVKIPTEQIVCDRDSMRHVMGNLLDNAIKFTGEKSQARIEIGGEDAPNAWKFWVRDNGVGFDPKYQERIFGIFQRLHRAEDYPGTGVGLALVQKAVHRMGGGIRAEGKLGEGAVFCLEIPKSKQRET